MNLLVDLGNSRLKWAWAEGDTLTVGEPVDHSRPLQPQLEVLWRQAPPIGRALVASVARPRLEAELAQAIHACVGVEPEFIASAASACGVHSAYATPEKLGVDRFVAMIALHARAAVPVVLASVGTALVLDALDADGRHGGGLIAPSPMLMQEALLGATARVSASSTALTVEMAADTEDAVRSGCWLAAAALVERFYATAAARMAHPPVLVIAGGAAAELAPLVRVPSRIEPDLVLRGLAVMARSGCAKPLPNR
ncbi:type III pantothenate kinase [Tahibacter amnicola]|uniref:Type III pantothenate kinase n=1 Tax=Tahibacter amnicola TaxID=2976241 RepID=A0ABY6BEV4_9GAMM|nr:type III pantothenate kinase [Tahibacter amnicola]UXI67798.1 type III pantothenate kinase [Tahibacter amnicola]